MTLRNCLQSLREGKYGDFAFFKSTLVDPGESLAVRKALELLPRDQLYKPLDLAKNYSEKSFGSELKLFMQRNKLREISLSRKWQHFHEMFPVQARYAKLHDSFHVLLGFNTSLNGELGVYSFVAQQNYSKALNKAYKAGLLFAEAFSSEKTSIQDVICRGKRLAERNGCLLAQPLEDYLGENLLDLRESLGLL